ncbi:MAG: energy-coupling factor transporter transmembrane component T [Bacillota bacterium]|nr:energy-coupling factor transporter transmembrane component T [Bacillota bacterium]
MSNRFDRLHPLVSFCYFAGSIILLLAMLHPLFLGAAFVAVLAVTFIYDHGENLRKWTIFMFISGLFIAILNPVFNERGRHVLFVAYNHRFSLEAILIGGMNALSLMSIIALFVTYNEVMTPNKLLFLFSKIFPQFAVLLMLTLRFIPLMRRRLEEISAVQASKGIYVTDGKLRDRVKNGMLYVQVLLTYSLEEAIQTADSMKARKYGTGRRTSYEYFIFTKTDLAALFYLLILFGTVLYGRIKGLGYLNVYPLMEPLSLSPQEGVTFVLFLLFFIFPFVVEVGGRIRWRL